MNDDTQIRSGKLTYLLWCLEGTVVVKLTTTEGAPPVRVSCPLWRKYREELPCDPTFGTVCLDYTLNKKSESFLAMTA
ncbi:hypothetical protein SBA5_1030004 [Candidatus Sulfotelmatomonas gaucii]|uniref:Uncharacterized protein n=1 Tax=Candidatus Sulfuritelmatomonas gaucii TaxID=2043161 RepID=A0A2N9L2P0_9BACT|nr:hypothetical protein SBA5_1030004 [Candidatus Sulfotelmatomonas gaucii]